MASSIRSLAGMLRQRGVFISHTRLVAATTPARRWQQTEASQNPAPEIYTVAPPQPRVRKPGQLESWQIEQFFEEGYVMVPNFYTNAELQLAIEAVKECVDIVANKLYNGGKIQDKCEGAGFYKRMTLIEEQFKGATVLLHKMGFLPPGFRRLWAHEKALNVVEQMIGPDIGGHPVWNLRVKTPDNEQATVPWHQDNAYLDPEALYSLIPTAWVPLIDANRTNGCMQVISRGHKLGKTARHVCCAGGTWYVELEDKDMETTLGIDIDKQAVTCAVPFGGALFINNCVPHRSFENRSDKIRWSLDLRWQNPNLPNGFHGLKETLVMRKADDPNYEIDWEGFATIDRNKLQEEEVGHKSDEFDTTIHGPWMRRWEIVHHNRHSEAMKTAGTSWHGLRV